MQRGSSDGDGQYPVVIGSMEEARYLTAIISSLYSASDDGDGTTVINFGLHHTTTCKYETVALMMSRDAHKAPISWEAAGPTINYPSSFKTTKQNIKLDIFQCYTPLNDNDEEREVMGRQWLGKMNGNGDILADLCAFDNMIRGGRQNRNEGFIRQPANDRTTKQNFKSTISAYDKYSEDQCRK